MTRDCGWYARILVIAAISGQLAAPAAFADAVVRVGGVPVLTVPAPAGGLTPDQRAKTMQKNIDNALVAATNRTPSSVNVALVSGSLCSPLADFMYAR